MKGLYAALLILTSCLYASATPESTDVIIRFKSSNHAVLEAHYSSSTDTSTRSDLKVVLEQHAATKQAAVMQILETHNVLNRVTSLWLDNSIALRSASPSLISKLSKMDDVSEVVEDSQISLPAMDVTPTQPEDDITDVGKPQSNIAALNTGPLWAKGYTGEGVVVATIDSGVRWTHEALRGNYRGFAKSKTVVDHDYAFWTVNASTMLTPDTADIYGHGTHVTGTLAGQAQGIGMAPNATWIHAKAFDWSGGTSQSTLIAAAQWVLCPTKRDHTSADCSKGAHVISCSFGGNNSLTWLNPSVKVNEISLRDS